MSDTTHTNGSLATSEARPRVSVEAARANPARVMDLASKHGQVEIATATGVVKGVVTMFLETRDYGQR